MLLRRFRSLPLACLLFVTGTVSLAQSSTTPISNTVADAASTLNPVPVVVFSDFACPYSSEEYFTLQKLQAHYPGRLHVVYKASPLPIHPGAPLAHRAAMAAARQGKYDAMAELLYANQKQQERTAILGYARRLGLNMPKFIRDFDSPVLARELDEEVEESRALGVMETPTLFFDGRMLKGFQDEANLARLLNAPLVTQPPVGGAVVEPSLLTEMQKRPTAALGAEDAPLTLVEFTDFQCPFCRASVAPMEQLLRERGRDVRWVFRAFPLDFHPDAELAAEAALAAGEQGKFWPMHDLLFERQTALKPGDLHNYAVQLGLNVPAFDDALATHRFAPQIAADRALGVRAGVSGTPTFIIDGRLVTGARSLQELEQLADAHRALPESRNNAVVAGVTPSRPVAEHVVMSASVPDPVTLVWFTDVRSQLASQQAELLRKLQAHYSGRLRVLYKSFPIAAHPDSSLSGAALLAAQKQDAFWAMYDALAGRHDVMNESKLVSLASSLRLDASQFRANLNAAMDDVAADREEAGRRGIRGAPVIFLDGLRVDGLQREAAYNAILDQVLKARPVQAAAAIPR